MTNQEAIEILQEEHKYCLEPCYVLNAIEKAISALRSEPTGEPLTLEQLREKIEEVVWIEVIDAPKYNKWAIVDTLSKYAIEFTDGDLKLVSEYGKTWLAYAYQPAHIDREAWTAEWRELHGDKMVGLDDFGDDVYRHYHYSVCKSCGNGSAVKTNFCPVCGKAMTPKAWELLEKRLRG